MNVIDMEEVKKLVINLSTWNAMSYLPRFFASLDAQTSQEFTVTIIDNASSDGLVPWLHAHRPEVVVLRNFRHQGSARAHNQAIALALSRWEGENLDQRYILMTHPEIEYAPDAILRMRAYLDEHPEVAVCTPKLLRAFAHSFGDDGQPHIEHSLVIDSTGLVLTKSRQIKQRGAGEEDRGQYETTTEIFGGNGMCTLFRASALQAVRQGEEWFDEDFETGHEDDDLAWRLRRFGFRTMYLPEAVAWRWCQRPPEAKKWFVKTLHRTASFDSSQRARLLRNTVWMLVKNDDVGRLCAHVLWWIVPAISGVVRGACSLSGWKEGIHALLGLPQMFAKRKRLKQDALVKGAAMKKWFV